MSIKLLVENLHKSVTQKDLHDLFMQAGEVSSAQVITNSNTHVSRGFAFITMVTRSEADRAILMFDEHKFRGCQLKVGLAKAAYQL
jgi:RNA recognition motif-containing protein